MGEIPAPLVLYPNSVFFLSDNFQKIRAELEARSNLFWPCRTRSFLIEILLHLGQIYHQPGQIPDKTSRNPDHPAEKVRLHLQTHYSEKISLAGLSQEFCTNKTTLEEQFTALTGKTVFDYLRELRLSVARNLLQETSLPVSEIAEKTGFSDPTHFGRIFRNNAVLSAAGIPQYAAIMGYCIAGGGYLPVLCDKLLMTEGSGLYLAGPALVKAAISPPGIKKG